MVVSDLAQQKTQLLPIFLIVCLINEKNAHPSFPDRKETFVFFCPTNSSKLKIYSVYSDIKQQILKLEKLEQANVWHFCLTQMINQNSCRLDVSCLDLATQRVLVSALV